VLQAATSNNKVRPASTRTAVNDPLTRRPVIARTNASTTFVS
jgi:hypothetical protein